MEIEETSSHFPRVLPYCCTRVARTTVRVPPQDVGGGVGRQGRREDQDHAHYNPAYRVGDNNGEEGLQPGSPQANRGILNLLGDIIHHTNQGDDHQRQKDIGGTYNDGRPGVHEADGLALKGPHCSGTGSGHRHGPE